MKIVLLGAPGTGKGTQAKNISDHFGIQNISTGKIIRDNIEEKTELGLIVEKIVEKGELVSDEIIIQMVKNRISEEDCISGYILDGFPRTYNQAKKLEEIAPDINFALIFNVSKETIINRLSSRVECKKCGMQYNLKYNIPVVENVCDQCKGPLTTRPDDDIMTVENRLKIYDMEIGPIRSYYEKKGILYTIDDKGSVVNNFSFILEVLKKNPSTGE